MPKIPEAPTKEDSEAPALRVKAAGGELKVKEETGFYGAYAGFSKTLRAWLIAYGIGGPVLLLTNEQLSGAVLASGIASRLTYLFLGGVGIQVGAALLYKTAMWYLYMGELEEAFRSTRRYRWSEKVSEAFWLEIALDLAAVGLFACAALNLVTLLTSAA